MQYIWYLLSYLKRCLYQSLEDPERNKTKPIKNLKKADSWFGFRDIENPLVNWVENVGELSPNIDYGRRLISGSFAFFNLMFMNLVELVSHLSSEVCKSTETESNYVAEGIYEDMNHNKIDTL
jgi:hypothetical protein